MTPTLISLPTPTILSPFELTVQAIYSKSHPEYIKYIYLVAPISLAILNPIGFIMMEFQRTINSRNQSGGLCKALGKVLKGIAMNPIVNMTITGIIFNFILKSSLPQILDNIFLVLGKCTKNIIKYRVFLLLFVVLKRTLDNLHIS